MTLSSYLSKKNMFVQISFH